MASVSVSLTLIALKGGDTSAVDITFSRWSTNWTVFFIQQDRSYLRLYNKIFLLYLDLGDYGNPLTAQRGDEITNGNNLTDIANDELSYLLSPTNEEEIDIQTKRSVPEGINISYDIHLINHH